MAEAITVKQFNERLKNVLLSTDGLNDISVIGELSEYKPASSGHVYPTLKDGDNILRCTFFRGAVSTLRFKPQVGMKVVVFGSVSYYAPSGSLTFNLKRMDLYGEGEQKKALEELTAKLLSEGLFDAERKRPVPKYPRVIGVVTSQTGAVIRDIVDTVAKRFPAAVLLAPAKVQGEGADVTIVSGIELLNRYGVDVIIVGRGGGSADDLSAFNSEIVVRAVAASKVPVISAVGHATDKSLTDRAADLYAETPTAAATFATADLNAEKRNLTNLEIRMVRSVKGKVTSMRDRFRYPDSVLNPYNAVRLIDDKSSIVAGASQSADFAIHRILSNRNTEFLKLDGKLDPRRIKSTVESYIYTIDNKSEMMTKSLLSVMNSKRNSYTILDSRLNSDSPYNVLDRGFSYVTDDNGKALSSVSSVSTGSSITVCMRDGKLSAEVKEVRNNE